MVCGAQGALGASSILEWATATQIVATAAASGSTGVSDRGILAQLALHDADMNAGTLGRASTLGSSTWARGATAMHLSTGAGMDPRGYVSTQLNELNCDLEAHAMGYTSVHTARDGLERKIADEQRASVMQPRYGIEMRSNSRTQTNTRSAGSFCDRFNKSR